MTQQVLPVQLDREALRHNIQEKYQEVALEPEKGAHFHTGKPLAMMLAYDEREIDALPASTVESFAGTGNPLALAPLEEGSVVVDVGCGAGLDTLLAAQRVGPSGRVISVDMTPAMLEKAGAGARSLGLSNVEFREGFAESLPVADGVADVVISNGVVNLCPDKTAVLSEMHRVLRPGGRLQIADIMLQRPVEEEAKLDIDLWSG